MNSLKNPTTICFWTLPHARRATGWSYIKITGCQDLLSDLNDERDRTVSIHLPKLLLPLPSQNRVAAPEPSLFHAASRKHPGMWGHDVVEHKPQKRDGPETCLQQTTKHHWNRRALGTGKAFPFSHRAREHTNYCAIWGKMIPTKTALISLYLHSLCKS